MQFGTGTTTTDLGVKRSNVKGQGHVVATLSQLLQAESCDTDGVASSYIYLPL